jgi:ABC-type glutathione transport system ATPase component
MAQVPPDQLRSPAEFSSALIIGSSGTGKTASIATLHRVLRKRKLPTKIIYFDFDQDGAEPLLRLARAGYESMKDMLTKSNRIDPWIDDIVLFRYYSKRRKMEDRSDAMTRVIAPHRDTALAMDFIKDFNTIDDRCNFVSGLPVWKPGE